MTSIIRNIFHFRCYRTVEAALLRLVEPKIASASAQRPTSPIGIQVDLSVGIEPSQLLGKAFEVEIGQVGDESFGSIKDVHGNPMDPLKGNVQFTRTFGDLDLTSTSTSFIFSRRLDGICDKFALGDHLADEIIAASAIHQRHNQFKSS